MKMQKNRKRIREENRKILTMITIAMKILMKRNQKRNLANRTNLNTTRRKVNINVDNGNQVDENQTKNSQINNLNASRRNVNRTTMIVQ